MDKTLSEDHAATLEDRTSAGVFANHAKAQVEELAGQATVAAQHAYGQARDQVRETATVVARSVEQQPLIALLIAGFAW
jgi:folate-dependent phosphoribosylglycinamide formyltransferase PurN